MKTLYFLLLISITTADYCGFYDCWNSQQNNYLVCQKWCYGLINGCMKLYCCDSIERRGVCPKGCLFKKTYNLYSLACQLDNQCPIGYKCCSDDCYSFHKICKPLIHDACEAATTTSTTKEVATQIATKEPDVTTAEDVTTKEATVRETEETTTMYTNTQVTTKDDDDDDGALATNDGSSGDYDDPDYDTPQQVRKRNLYAKDFSF